VLFFKEYKQRSHCKGAVSENQLMEHPTTLRSLGMINLIYC